MLMLPADHARCAFTSRDGRRCRMLRSPTHPTLCVPHALQQAREEGAPPPAPPNLVAVGQLDNPGAVRRSLKKLFREAAAGNYSPQQVRVLAAMARLLLIHTRRSRLKRKKAGRHQ